MLNTFTIGQLKEELRRDEPIERAGFASDECVTRGQLHSKLSRRVEAIIANLPCGEERTSLLEATYASYSHSLNQISAATAGGEKTLQISELEP